MIQFSLKDDDVSRLQDLKAEAGKQDLSLNQFAKILFEDLLRSGSGHLPQGIDEKLKTLEGRLEKLEKVNQADFVVIAPKPLMPNLAALGLPPEPISKQIQAKRGEVVLRDFEMAEKHGVKLGTVNRWAKNPDKWPADWIYDGDRQLWIMA